MDMLDTAVKALDLVEVFEDGDGGGYDWNVFKAWRSPSGRFYWWDESGCSCNDYGDGFRAASDFGDGDRDALERAYRDWAEGGYSNYGVIEGVARIRAL